MKYLINLFPEKERSLSDKIIYFAFHYLRYILVITQFIAICVFFFRFKVDQDIVDLREKLNQKQSIIEATGGLIQRVEEIDKKMTQVQTIIKDQQLFETKYAYFFTQVPTGVSINQFNMEMDNISVEGSSDSIDQIRVLYEALIEQKRFQVVDLASIRKEEESFEFSLYLSKFTP